MDTKNKKNLVNTVKQLSAGTKKHFPNSNQQVQVGGDTRTVAQVTGGLDSLVTLREESEAAKATAKVKLEAEKAQAPTLLALVTAWVLFIRATLGNSPEILGDFGLDPIKPKKPRSAEAKAIAAAKRDATRQARGTRSKKAKQDIHGNVAAKLVVTPLAAPQPASPAAPPAGSAQPNGAGGSGTTHGP